MDVTALLVLVCGHPGHGVGRRVGNDASSGAPVVDGGRSGHGATVPLQRRRRGVGGGHLASAK